MILTVRQLNRATLHRQMLLRRERLGAAEAVARAVALQAQEAPSPYLALWSRVEGFDAADLARALERQDVVKAQLLRVTLHAVAAADYPAFHEAMQPTLRAARLNDRRFRSAGLSHADADALLPEVLAFAASPRSNAEADAWLDARIGDHPKPSVWWAYRQYAPLVHAPNGGPWSFGPRPSYVAARDQDRTGDIAVSTQHLVVRYLEGFGPATIQDIAQFSTMVRPPIRDAVTALGDRLERHEGPGGAALLDVRGGAIPDEDSPAPPRLLPMWDSVLLAHADRDRIIPAAYRRALSRSNGDTLPALLVDGFVAGVWRPTEDGIEVTAFERLTAEAWRGVAAEAAALIAFLADREPLVYRRYQRWWSELPSAEVRVLGR